MSNFWKNKNISITGGHGFLGKYLKKKLEERDCKKISLVDRKNISKWILILCRHHAANEFSRVKINNY